MKIAFFRTTLKWIAFLGITFIFTFLFLELVLRLFPFPTQSKNSINYEYHPFYKTYVPGDLFHYTNEAMQSIEIQIDSYGLRNEPGKLSRSPLWLFGDSFVSAVNTPLSETFCSLISNSTPCYNAGVDGSSIFNSYYLFLDLLKISKPKKILLAFYLGNDFRDNSLFQEQPKSHSSLVFQAFSQLMIHTKVFPFLFQNFYLGKFKKRAKDPKFSYSLAELEMLLLENTPWKLKMIEKTKMILKKWKKTCDRLDIDIHLLAIPSKAQVDQDLSYINGIRTDRRFSKRVGQLKKDGIDFDEPNRQIEKVANELSIDCTSLLTHFRIYKNSRLYYPTDLHWTPLAQRIAQKHLKKKKFSLS